MNPTSRLKRYLAPKILFAGLLLLLINSGYLAVSGEPTILYLANVLVHVGGGAVLIVPFLWSGRNLVHLCQATQGERSAVVASAGVWAMSAGMGAGVALMILGNLTPYRWLFYLHIGLVAAAVASLALAFAPYPQRVGQAPWLRQAWRVGMVAIALALILPATLLVAKSYRSDPYAVANPPLPPYSQDEEGMFGKDGPFHPASLETTTGGRIPSAFFMTSRRCADCHPDIFRQWSESAHRRVSTAARSHGQRWQVAQCPA